MAKNVCLIEFACAKTINFEHFVHDIYRYLLGNQAIKGSHKSEYRRNHWRTP
jgi:hypothetical protein